MTNGTNHSGTIHVGDLDMWTFPAKAGEAVLVRIGEVGCDSVFVPWIRLYGPDGAGLAPSFNWLAAEVAVVASSTGTYTLVVATHSQAPATPNSTRPGAIA